MSTQKNSRRLSVAELLALILPAAAAAAASWQVLAHQPTAETARLSVARDHLRGLTAALVAFAGDKGGYPDQATGLATLVDEKVIAILPLDPWGRPYQYRYPGRQGAYDLYSLGPDGAEGADDVVAGNLYPGNK